MKASPGVSRSKAASTQRACGAAQMEAHGTSVCCRNIPLARAVNAAAVLNIDALDHASERGDVCALPVARARLGPVQGVEVLREGTGDGEEYGFDKFGGCREAGGGMGTRGWAPEDGREGE